ARPAHDATLLDRADVARPERRRLALAEGDDRQRRCLRLAGAAGGDVRRDRRRLPRPDQLLDRQALHADVLRARREAPGGERLSGRPDDVAADRAQELLDGGDDDRGRGAGDDAVPRARAELRRVGLHRRQPAPVSPRAGAAARAALRHGRRLAGAVRFPARHGARSHRGQSALEPGPRPDLRGRVGQGAAVSRWRGRGAGPTRRDVLAASLAALAPLAACTRDDAPRYDGGWIGADAERGHLLRSGWPATKSGRPPEVAVTKRVGAIVVGAGIAGLGAARALLRGRVDDCHVLELEDSAGGNSRGHAMAGMRCPLGAHYLPVPGASASEVIELLDELGVRRSVAGRAVYDERMLCHSPQERLFIDGGWRDGLLPPIEALPAAERAATLAEYRAFSAAVAAAGDDGAFEIPTALSRWSDSLAALDRITFAAWLDARGLATPALRWYLDYCCRDDYGAGSSDVSAWAGLHYFASRHGFRAPG